MKQKENYITMYSSVLVILVVVILLAGVLIITTGLFLPKNLRSFKNTGDNNGTLANNTNKPAPQKAKYTYKVKSVLPEELVLSSEKGDLKLTKSYIAAIFQGSTRSSKVLQYQDLEIGDSVNVEVIPKVSATLFVSKM